MSTLHSPGEPTIDSTIVDVQAEEVSPNTVSETPEMPVEPETKHSVEEFKIKGDDLVARIKDLVHQGNIRRILVKNEEGVTLIEIPLTVGVVGGVISAAFFPVLAAVGAIGAMVAHLTLVIEKTGD